MTKKQITIYTDGGSKPNPGPGGWAALLIYGETRKAISGGEADTTNNRMEMTAAIEALNALNEPCQVDLYTDSEYLKNGITSWLAGWQRSGWKTASRKPVKNKDLWLKLVDAIARHDVSWHWVRGHAGVDGNERVDQLASAARKPYEV